MNIRPKTKRRLIILALGVMVLIAAGVAVYLRYLQMHNARLAQYRSAAMSGYASGDYAAALPWFDKYLTLSKTAERGAGKVDAEALFAYGKSRAAIELPGARHLWEAKNVFERYLMLKPGDEQAELMLLDIYPRLNHNQEAVTLADDRLARRPDDVAALKAKAKALIQKGLQQDPKLFAEAQKVGEKLN